MRSPVGLFFWSLLAIIITALSVAKPDLEWSWWVLIVAGLMIVAWLAWHFSIYGRKRKTRHGEWKVDTEINHFITNIALFFGMLFFSIGKRLTGKVMVRKAVALQKPKLRMATRSIDVMVMHPKLTRKPTKILLGYDKRIRPIAIDLAEQHTMIGASTKGGKTTLLRSILIQLLSKPEYIRPGIFIIDLKGAVEDGLRRFSAMFTYVEEAADAVKLLRRLTMLVDERNKDASIRKRAIILFVDEVADLTSSTTDKELRRACKTYLSRLAQKARSANVFLVISTQHPRYDVVPKTIANNLMRKIALPVASRTQLEVVLEHKPRVDLPSLPGEFLLWEGLKLRRGRTIMSRLSEIDEVMLMQLERLTDPAFVFYRYVAGSRRVGDHVPGQGKAYAENQSQEWCTQPFVRDAYAKLIKLGILSKASRGSSSKLLVGFFEGAKMLRGAE